MLKIQDLYFACQIIKTANYRKITTGLSNIENVTIGLPNLKHLKSMEVPDIQEF